MSEGSRLALIVTCVYYEDPELNRLDAPYQDAEAFARILCFILRSPMNITCHERPYLSRTQPYFSLNGYSASPMSAVPPLDSLFHNASTSSFVLQTTRNDTDGLNLERACADEREFLIQKFNGENLHRSRGSVVKRCHVLDF
jgi:hypothetical protein